MVDSRAKRIVEADGPHRRNKQARQVSITLMQLGCESYSVLSIPPGCARFTGTYYDRSSPETYII